MAKACKNRIEEWLARLSVYSSSEGGITRQTFSKAWEDALQMIREEMKKLGMNTRIDGFGNLIGSYNPSNLNSKPIGIGSHIDTVINGGAYDGALGIIAGLELIQIMREEGITLAHPVEVIAFAEEEGGVFGKGCMGSEYITAHTPLEELELFLDGEGKSAGERAGAVLLEKALYGSDYGWGKGYFHAFCEIHAEQGAILEERNKKIGIVDGVVGILRSQVTFRGQANHAGTTQMNRRKDAAVGLSEFVLGMYRYGLKRNGNLVITNGKLAIEPNQHNVVPGKSYSVCEIRAEQEEEILEAFAFLKKYAEKIAEEYQLEVNCSEPVYVKPIGFSYKLLDRQSHAAKQRADTMHIFSWAGHDAKLMASVAPAMMLFVPSRNGMSHCAEEYTDPADVAEAVDFLLEVVKEIA